MPIRVGVHGVVCLYIAKSERNLNTNSYSKSKVCSRKVRSGKVCSRELRGDNQKKKKEKDGVG